MEFPAFCPECGAIFPSGFSFGGQVRGVTMSGNKSKCPACGAWADIPDGVFDITDGVIEILSGPAITRQRLEALRDVLLQVKQGGTSSEQAIEQLEAQVPELAPFWLRIAQNPAVTAWLVVLLTTVLLLLTALDQGHTEVDVQQITNQVIEQSAHPSP
jgi:hypothetical protein